MTAEALPQQKKHNIKKLKFRIKLLKLHVLSRYGIVPEKSYIYRVKNCKLQINSTTVHFLSLMMLFLWQNKTTGHFFSFIIKNNGKIVYFYQK